MTSSPPPASVPSASPAGPGSAAGPGSPPTARTRPVPGTGLLVAAIFLVALNLRAPLAQVPPLAPTIEVALGLSGLALGLLTALPVLCMGLFAPVAPRLAHLVGREGAIGLALLALLAGTFLRLGGSVPVLLYGGTFLVGVGIAVAGTVLPGVIKEFFPARPGLATGVYMGAMTIGAVAAAAVAVPLAAALGSWQRSLAAGASIAVVGLAAWWPVVRKVNDHDDPDVDPAPAGRLPWRSRTAWVLAGYLAVQSTLFYTQLAWIPASYVDAGSSPERAGLLLAAFTAAQLFAGIGAPALSDRIQDRRLLLVAVVVLTCAGMTGLTTTPTSLPWVWMTVLGLGMGAGFSLGLVFLVAYAPTPAATARLSGMAFLVGYCCAALGPSAFGALRDSTGGFTVPWSVLLALAAGQALVIRLMRPGRSVQDLTPTAS